MPPAGGLGWDPSLCFFKQKTAYEIPKRDWSSDVCSSDLPSLLFWPFVRQRCVRKRTTRFHLGSRSSYRTFPRPGALSPNRSWRGKGPWAIRARPPGEFSESRTRYAHLPSQCRLPEASASSKQSRQDGVAVANRSSSANCPARHAIAEVVCSGHRHKKRSNGWRRIRFLKSLPG